MIRNLLKRIPKEFKYVVFAILCSITIISFPIGLVNGFFNDCTYNSILSNINIPYVIGCELTKPRFKESTGRRR